MTGTLIRKEIRQHWLAFLAVGTAALAGFTLLYSILHIRDRSGTPFEAFRLFTVFFTLLGASVLNHRLVALEYKARTQLFLEGLPLSRSHMVAVKYFMGIGSLLALLAVVWLVPCVLAWETQALTLKFSASMLIRACSLAWFLHSFFFLMSLAGRYRIALYLAGFIGLMMVSEHRALDWSQFAPVLLVDERFAFERLAVPWTALLQTWAWSAGLSLAGYSLSLLREGSIAALLAERMSHREKVFIAVMLCGLVYLAATLSEKTRKAPFNLQGAAVAVQPGVTVQALSKGGADDPRAVHLARTTAADLAAVRSFLGLPLLPPVFIVQRDDLDADRFERGELEKSEGVHVRANFGTGDWPTPAFRAWLLREVLAQTTGGRAEAESRRWVLDGIGWFWVTESSNSIPTAILDSLKLRALYGTENGFGAADLDRWLQFREKVGEDIAAGVAWSGLHTLARRQGTNACQTLLRSILRAAPPKDFRAALAPLTWSSALRASAQTDPSTLFSSWQQELATWRESHSTQLERLPRLKAKATFVPVSTLSRRARFHLTVEPQPAAAVRFALLYHRFEAFGEPVEFDKLQRERATLTASPSIELPQSFSRGQWLLWGFAVEVPELGCPVVSGFHRQEVP